MNKDVDNPKNFIKRFIAFSIGPIGGAVIGFITVPVMTYLVTPSEFGKVTMFMVFQQASILIILMGLDQSYGREYNDYNDKNKLLLHSFLPPFLLSILLFFVLVLLFRDISNALFGEENLYSIVVLALSIVISIVYRFSSFELRMQEKAGIYSVGQILQRFFNLMLLYPLFFIIENNYLLLITANAVSLFLVSLYYLYWMKDWRQYKCDLDKNLLSKLFKFGLPLIFNGLFFWMLNSIDKVALRLWGDFNDLGIYSAAYRFAMILLIVQQAFAIFWTPTAYRWFSNHVPIKRYNQVAAVISFGLTSLFLIAIALRELLYLVLDEEYYQSVDIFPLLLVYPVMYTLSEVTGIGINFTRKTYHTVFISGLVAGINFYGNYLLVPFYGAFGAAISTAFAFIIFFLLRSVISFIIWQRMPMLKHLFHIVVIIIMLGVMNSEYETFAFLIILSTVLILGIPEIRLIMKNVIRKKMYH